jgi:protein required for attachment to host cells
MSRSSATPIIFAKLGEVPLHPGQTLSKWTAMNSLIIVADLGRMKAYRITQDELQPGSTPSFEDLADIDLENQHSKVSDRFTYQAGRSGTNTVGERHSEKEEAEGQQLEAMAQTISDVAMATKGSIYFAAPQTALRPLVDALNADVRKRISKELPLNLVKASKLDLLKRFELS